MTLKDLVERYLEVDKTSRIRTHELHLIYKRAGGSVHKTAQSFNRALRLSGFTLAKARGNRQYLDGYRWKGTF